MPRYDYKPNRSAPGLPAQQVGEEMERIRDKYGRLTPPLIVDESQPPGAVLHREIDAHLSPDQAKRQWMMHKARNLVNVLVIVPERPDARPEERAVPAFVSVVVGPVTAPESRAYEPMPDVLADPARRARLVRRALDKLRRVQNEFRFLDELDAVWSEVEELAVHFEREEQVAG